MDSGQLGQSCVPLNLIDDSNCTPNLNRITFEQAIAAGLLLPPAQAATQPQVLHLSGVWELTTATSNMLNPYFFAPGSVLTFKPGAELRLAQGTYLGLNNTTLQGCDCLWKGIVVEANAFLKTANATLIRDAQYAIQTQPNALLTVQKTTFEDNFVGIYIPQLGTLGNSQWLSLDAANFYGNEFRAPSILPPYQGATPLPMPDISGGLTNVSIPTNPFNRPKGLAGIYALDLNELDLRPANPHINAPNRFEYLHSGIVTALTSLNLGHVHLREIYPDPAYPANLANGGTGVCALDLGTGNNAKFALKINDPANVSEINRFDSLLVGVFSRGMDAYIYNTAMKFISQVGISCVNGIACEHRIEGNSIQTESLGMALLFNDPSDEFSFGSNTIHVSGQNAGQFNTASGGILLMEQGNAHNGPASILFSDIYADNASFGILALGSAGMMLNNNQVHLLGTDASQFGLAAFASTNLIANCNAINPDSSSVADNRNTAQTFALATDFVQGELACNYTDLTQTGASFWNVNALDFKGTEIRHHHTGLWLPLGAEIGSQTLTGNRWLGTYTDFAARNDNTVPFDIALSEFQVDTVAQPAEFWPASVLPGGNVWFLPISGSNYACNDLQFCNQLQAARLASGASHLSSANLSQMQAGSGSFASATQAYVAERQLYRRLQAEAAQGRLSSAQSTYLQQQAQGDAGLVEDLAQSQAQALRGGASAYQARQDYRLFREQAATAWRANDSVLLANPASAQAWQNRLALAQDAETQYQNLAQVQQQVLQQRQASLQQLMQQNGSLRLQAPAAQADQVVNGIYWASLAQASFGFSAQDLLSLRLIADDCPEQLGPAVYRARALLHVHDGTAIWRPSACAPIARRSAQASSSEPSPLQSSEFRLYPNPATQLVTLVLPQGLSGQVQLHCYNSLGQLLRQTQLEASSSTLEYSLQDLAPGLYYLQLRQGEKTWTASLRVQ